MTQTTLHAPCTTTQNTTPAAWASPALCNPRALFPAAPSVPMPPRTESLDGRPAERPRSMTALELHDALAQPMTPTLPEAAVSMNLFVDLPGYPQRAQVTGRGHSGPEAAQHLKAGVDALQAAFAPAPLPSRTERLAALLACGTAKAVAAGNMARLDRLMRAYLLVVKGMVETVTVDGVPNGQYEVQSQTTAGKRYLVQGQSCECQDARKHADDATAWCMHALAALYEYKLDAQEAAF